MKSNEQSEAIDRLDDMLQDLTNDLEQRQTRMEEDVWRRVEAEYSFTHAPIMFVVVDEDRVIRRANQAATDVLGPLEAGDSARRLLDTFCCNRRAAGNTKPFDCEGCGGCAVESAVMSAISEGKRTENVEATLWQPLGRVDSERTFLVSAVPLSLGGNIFALVSMQDVTEWKHMLQELHRARRLDALSTLTGGLAHDFNNYLNVIIGYANLARNEAREGKPTDLFLTLIEDIAFAAAQVSNDLLSIACQSPPAQKQLSLGNVISHAAFESLAGFDTTFTLDTPTDLWPVEGDPQQLRQAFAALLVNGAEAMEGSGTIAITAKNIDVPTESPLPLVPGPYVHVSVVDDGKGIEPDLMHRILQTHVTTKTGALGLGLTATRATVMRMDGHLNISQRAEGGTVVNVYLPSRPGEGTALTTETDEGAAPAKAGADEGAAPGGTTGNENVRPSEGRPGFRPLSTARGALQDRLRPRFSDPAAGETTSSGAPIDIHATSPSAARLAAVLSEAEGVKKRVLLLEDNKLLRGMTAEMLSSFGWNVITVGDGDSAVTEYKKALEGEHPFDVIALDLTIAEGMGGKETMRRIRELDDEVKAVIVSGFTNDPVMTNFAEYGFAGAIGKPFSFLALDTLLRSVLER